MGRRGEAEGEMVEVGGGVKYGWAWKSAVYPDWLRQPRWCRVGWERGLKGDGLFANCGHFWPEHDRFNDHFNAWLNRAETWNAVLWGGVGGGCMFCFLGFVFRLCTGRKRVHSWFSMSPGLLVPEQWMIVSADISARHAGEGLLALPRPTTQMPHVFEVQQNRGAEGKHPGDINLMRTIHHRCVRWRD